MGATAESVHIHTPASGAAAERTVERAIRGFMAANYFVEAPPSRAQRTLSLQRSGNWLSLRDSGGETGGELAAAISRATGHPALLVSLAEAEALSVHLYEAGCHRDRLGRDSAGHRTIGHASAWTPLLANGDAAQFARLLHARSGSATDSIVRLARAVGLAPEAALPAASPRSHRQFHFRLPNWADLRTASGPPLLSDGGYPGYTLRLTAGQAWTFDTGTYIGNEGGPLRGLELRLQGRPLISRQIEVTELAVEGGVEPGRIRRFTPAPSRRAFQLRDLELGPGWGLPPEGRIEDWYAVFTRQLRSQSFAGQHRRRIIRVSLSGHAHAPCDGVLELLVSPTANPGGAVAIPIHIAVRPGWK
jgi:hypothetical protein